MGSAGTRASAKQHDISSLSPPPLEEPLPEPSCAPSVISVTLHAHSRRHVGEVKAGPWPLLSHRQLNLLSERSQRPKMGLLTHQEDPRT